MDSDFLYAWLQKPLPGARAHAAMRPLDRPATIASIPREQCRPGAVLILLVSTADNISIPLIERSLDGGPHSGQIALPGGSRETEDRTAADTALREAHEEIGVPREHCRVLGELTPLHIDVSGFIVTPVVAWYAPPAYQPHPDYRLASAEVQRLVNVHIEDLLQSETVESIEVRGHVLRAPTYRVGKTAIWGATAMILAEFTAVWRAASQSASKKRSPPHP